jgi:hypothetical protein
MTDADRQLITTLQRCARRLEREAGAGKKRRAPCLARRLDAAAKRLASLAESPPPEQKVLAGNNRLVALVASHVRRCDPDYANEYETAKDIIQTVLSALTSARKTADAV